MNFNHPKGNWKANRGEKMEIGTMGDKGSEEEKQLIRQEIDQKTIDLEIS